MKARPFLSTLAVSHEPRPLMSALRAIPTPPSTSPWSPKPEAAAVVAPAIDVEAIREAARAEGREQGLQETAALRAQLAKLCDELARARESAVGATADQIADAACTVIAAWTESAPKTELFAPIVKTWLSKVASRAIATVHPEDADAVRTLIGDAAISIEADRTMARGDLRLRSEQRELAHSWSARLDELREVIAASVGSCSRANTEETGSTEATEDR